MPNIDQFESVFNAAAKRPYVYQPVTFERVGVMTDLDQTAADLLTEKLRGWLSAIFPEAQWSAYSGDRSETIDKLLAVIDQDKPDLIATYRNLHSPGWQWPYTLGRRLDVLTQATLIPVLVVPHPNDSAIDTLKNTDRVMAITDHLSGDHQLVNAAAHFTTDDGLLMLTHVEDDRTFERYIQTIAKIPTIDTDLARAEIHKQLLKEPTDFIESCRKVLAEHHINVDSIVRSGHRLSVYRELIDERNVDLLVMNTKDQDQLAMHGLAYSLTVEMRTTPLLLL